MIGTLCVLLIGIGVGCGVLRCSAFIVFFVVAAATLICLFAARNESWWVMALMLTAPSILIESAYFITLVALTPDTRPASSKRRSRLSISRLAEAARRTRAPK